MGLPERAFGSAHAGADLLVEQDLEVVISDGTKIVGHQQRRGPHRPHPHLNLGFSLEQLARTTNRKPSRPTPHRLAMHALLLKGQVSSKSKRKPWQTCECGLPGNEPSATCHCEAIVASEQHVIVVVVPAVWHTASTPDTHTT